MFGGLLEYLVKFFSLDGIEMRVFEHGLKVHEEIVCFEMFIISMTTLDYFFFLKQNFVHQAWI